jgi:hypothetical protein
VKEEGRGIGEAPVWATAICWGARKRKAQAKSRQTSLDAGPDTKPGRALEANLKMVLVNENF